MKGPVMPDVRIEKDSLGEMKVPAEALWGPQTQRAVENFPISGRPLPPAFIHTLGLLKASAARVNRELGLLAPPLAEAVLLDSYVAHVRHGGSFR